MNIDNEVFVNCDNLVKIYKVADLEVVALHGLDLTVSAGDILDVGTDNGDFINVLKKALGGYNSFIGIDISEDELEKVFGAYGEVTSVKIIRDKWVIKK